MRNRAVAFRRWVSFSAFWAVRSGVAVRAYVYMRKTFLPRTTASWGAHPFGESVNLYSGSLSFEATDASIPGEPGPALSLSSPGVTA